MSKNVPITDKSVCFTANTVSLFFSHSIPTQSYCQSLPVEEEVLSIPRNNCLSHQPNFLVINFYNPPVSAHNNFAYSQSVNYSFSNYFHNTVTTSPLGFPLLLLTKTFSWYCNFDKVLSNTFVNM